MLVGGIKPGFLDKRAHKIIHYKGKKGWFLLENL